MYIYEEMQLKCSLNWLKKNYIITFFYGIKYVIDSSSYNQAHLSATLCTWKTVLLTRRLQQLSQHMQFVVESDEKLHGVTNLSAQFPGISPYISENGGLGYVWVSGVLMPKGVKSICSSFCKSNMSCATILQMRRLNVTIVIKRLQRNKMRHLITE